MRHGVLSFSAPHLSPLSCLPSLSRLSCLPSLSRLSPLPLYAQSLRHARCGCSCAINTGLLSTSLDRIGRSRCLTSSIQVSESEPFRYVEGRYATTRNVVTSRVVPRDPKLPSMAAARRCHRHLSTLAPAMLEAWYRSSTVPRKRERHASPARGRSKVGCRSDFVM